MANADLAAIQRIVEDATTGYARQIAYACSWKDGSPDEILVTEELVRVRYGGALPFAVWGPLKKNIVDDLTAAGFSYRGSMYGDPGWVQILPREDD